MNDDIRKLINEVYQRTHGHCYDGAAAGNFLREVTQVLAARATPAQPDAYEQRAMRIGKHVLEFATRGGWKDDGEGAFEYIQRHSYAVGYEDAGGKLGQFGTYSVNRWPIAAIVAGAQPFPSSVGAAIRALKHGRTMSHFATLPACQVFNEGWHEALSAAAALAEQVQGQRDTERINLLEAETVDTIYLDDGRIIDVGGKHAGDLRKAIDAFAAPSIAQDGQGGNHG
jgi:hypothetical protein